MSVKKEDQAQFSDPTRPLVSRRQTDEWLARTVRRSRRAFYAMVTVNVISIILIAFHVGMWRKQAEDTDARLGALSTEVSALRKEVAKLGGMIEGQASSRAVVPVPVPMLPVPGNEVVTTATPAVRVVKLDGQ